MIALVPRHGTKNPIFGVLAHGLDHILSQRGSNDPSRSYSVSTGLNDPFRSYSALAGSNDSSR